MTQKYFATTVKLVTIFEQDRYSSLIFKISLTVDFERKKYKGFPYKMNPDQISKEILHSFLQGGLINLQGNSFIKFSRNNFKKDFLVKHNYMVIIFP